MARRKNPGLIKVCPAKDCRSGYADKQRSLTEGQLAEIPADVLETRKSGLKYCTYCDAVWEDRGDYKTLYGFLDGNSKFTRYKGG